MEKIKAALAKVKSKGTTENKKSVLTKKVVKNEVDLDINKISYETTKVISLNSEVLENNRIVSHLNHNVHASLFDSLRTQVLQKMEQNNWQTIAVVSSTPESGKTVVSTNLAISIARQPQKTAILVDFDLRKPKVASYMGIQVNPSLNEYFEGTAEIEDVLVNPSIQRLVVMPTMQPVPNASSELASSKVSRMVKELKERYASRIIIYDLPPLLSADDAMVVIPQVDCVLMVIANGVSTAKEIEDAFRLVPKDKLVGVVYNQAEEEAKTYYY